MLGGQGRLTVGSLFQAFSQMFRAERISVHNQTFQFHIFKILDRLLAIYFPANGVQPVLAVVLKLTTSRHQFC